MRNKAITDCNRWWESLTPERDNAFYQLARQRQNALTKPPGSLGMLEDIAIRLAGLQQTEHPSADLAHIILFAGDHGIAEEKVSAFPQEVTAQMLANYAAGGACISVFAQQLGAKLDVVDVGVANQVIAAPCIYDAKVGFGTNNALKGHAMTQGQFQQAFAAGRNAAERAIHEGTDILVLGEMGIANTTIASALLAIVLQKSAEHVTGRGTGVDDLGHARKVKVITLLSERYCHLHDQPLALLTACGGFEIAALTGAFIRSAQLGVPIMVDGLICSVAALIAQQIRPDARSWFFWGHCSRELGSRLVLDHLREQPLLQLDMALGEGSGAALAISILRAACAVHNQMATFSDAGVAQR